MAYDRLSSESIGRAYTVVVSQRLKIHNIDKAIEARRVTSPSLDQSKERIHKHNKN